MPRLAHRVTDRLQGRGLRGRQCGGLVVADLLAALLPAAPWPLDRAGLGEQAELHEPADHGPARPRSLGQRRRGLRAGGGRGEHAGLGRRGLPRRRGAGGGEQRIHPHPRPGPHAGGQNRLEHLAPPGHPPLGHPLRQFEHPPRQQRPWILDADHALERRLRQVASAHGHAVGESLAVGPPQRHEHAAARLDVGRQPLRHEVVERLVHAVGKDDGGDRAPAHVVLVPLRTVLEELALACAVGGHGDD